MQLSSGNLTLNMSKQLNNYLVTKYFIENVNSKRIHLAIDIERKTGPFWISLFVPSICLIFAAEITLFIDESHFKATVSVALTINLVMYTLYRTIQDKLPEDAMLKLIDIWLLHGLLMPMVVFALLVTKELLKNKEEELFQSKPIKVAHSSVNVSPKIDNPKLDIDAKKTLLACQALVPMFSIMFFIIFFIVISHGK